MQRKLSISSKKPNYFDLLADEIFFLIVCHMHIFDPKELFNFILIANRFYTLTKSDRFWQLSGSEQILIEKEKGAGCIIARNTMQMLGYKNYSSKDTFFRVDYPSCLRILILGGGIIGEKLETALLTVDKDGYRAEGGALVSNLSSLENIFDIRMACDLRVNRNYNRKNTELQNAYLDKYFNSIGRNQGAHIVLIALDWEKLVEYDNNNDVTGFIKLYLNDPRLQNKLTFFVMHENYKCSKRLIADFTEGLLKHYPKFKDRIGGFITLYKNDKPIKLLDSLLITLLQMIAKKAFSCERKSYLDSLPKNLLEQICKKYLSKYDCKRLSTASKNWLKFIRPGHHLINEESARAAAKYKEDEQRRLESGDSKDPEPTHWWELR